MSKTPWAATQLMNCAHINSIVDFWLNSKQFKWVKLHLPIGEYLTPDLSYQLSIMVHMIYGHFIQLNFIYSISKDLLMYWFEVQFFLYILCDAILYIQRERETRGTRFSKILGYFVDSHILLSSFKFKQSNPKCLEYFRSNLFYKSKALLNYIVHFIR